ncbi:unnamed protein product [Amaranthus hypochondriacus]
MMIALATKNKLGFIDGSLPKPTENDPNCAAWKRCDAIIISYILRSLESSIARSVLFFGTSQEVWKVLEERFSQTSGPQLYTLQLSLAELKQSAETSVTDFYTQIKAIWDQINQMNPLPLCINAGCKCAQAFLKQQQEERLVQFLMKLDSKFVSIRTNILMMQPLPTMSMAYRLLVQEEKQRQISSIEEDTSKRGMVFAAEYKKNTRSQFQGSRMTFKSNGNKIVVAGSGKRPYCNHCKYPGHTVDTCYKLHGYPPDFMRGKGKSIAAIAQADEGEEELDEHTAHISAEQFNSILKALQGPNTDSIASQALMAGTNLASVSGSW